MNPLRVIEKWGKIKLFFYLCYGISIYSFFHVRILFYVKNHLERSNEKLFFSVCFSQFSFLLSFPLTLECRLIAWMHLLNVNIMRNHRKKKKKFNPFHWMLFIVVMCIQCTLYVDICIVYSIHSFFSMVSLKKIYFFHLSQCVHLM